MAPARPATARPAAPKARAPAKTAFDLSTPAGQGHALAETVVMAFIDRLRHEAEARGGTLTLADLDRLAVEFHNKSAALRQAFEQTFEAYGRARERAKFAQNRNYPFDRLLVQRFESLLAPGGAGRPNKRPGADNAAGSLGLGASAPGASGRGIPRRVLPGFFMAVEMMLGRQILEAYQEHCRAIVERISKAQGGKFGWPDLYADAEAATLAFDALVAMASYFADYDKRALVPDHRQRASRAGGRERFARRSRLAIRRGGVPRFSRRLLRRTKGFGRKRGRAHDLRAEVRPRQMPRRHRGDGANLRAVTVARPFPSFVTLAQ
ncbi:MAG: hypothetical protein EXR04_05710, partial [Rhodospirillales bacterium]|nr:hypothetical protein [Rhodospirillales bacterium]